MFEERGGGRERGEKKMKGVERSGKLLIARKRSMSHFASIRLF